MQLDETLYMNHTEKQNIIQEHLVPMIRTDITRFISDRRIMLHTSNVLELTAKILLTVGTCTAFWASQSPDYSQFVVVTGFINVCSISVFALSSYFHKESGERTAQLNTTLRSIGITGVPDVTYSDS